MILHAYNNFEIIEVQLILINTRCYSYFYYYYYLYLSYTTSEVAVRHVPTECDSEKFKSSVQLDKMKEK